MKGFRVVVTEMVPLILVMDSLAVKHMVLSALPVSDMHPDLPWKREAYRYSPRL